MGFSGRLLCRCDNGPEFIRHKFVRWATEHGICIEYIQPGKPQQNAYIERYNRTIRYGWLSKHLFDTLDEVQDEDGLHPANSIV